MVVEGAPLSTHIECDTPEWRQMLWYDQRLMPGSTRLDFDNIRPTTLRPFGLVWAGPAEAGQTLEVRIGFSLRGVEQARTNLHQDLKDARGAHAFDARLTSTQRAWRKHLDAIQVTDRRLGGILDIYRKFAGEEPTERILGPRGDIETADDDEKIDGQKHQDDGKGDGKDPAFAFFHGVSFHAAG